MSGRGKRTISELTAGDVDPVVHALLPFVTGLDRDDERTASVVEAIESLFSKLKQGSVCLSHSYDSGCGVTPPSNPRTVGDRGAPMEAASLKLCLLISLVGPELLIRPLLFAARAVDRRDGA